MIVINSGRTALRQPVFAEGWQRPGRGWARRCYSLIKALEQLPFGPETEIKQVGVGKPGFCSSSFVWIRREEFPI